MTSDSPNDSEIEILKILINDEHHYRDMVQRRVSFNTTLVTALIALFGALSLRVESAFSYFVVSFVGLLIYVISLNAISSVERIYLHFIDTIRAREEVEFLLGIRDIKKKRDGQKDRPEDISLSKHNTSKHWKYKALFLGSWVSKDDNSCGYFCKTKKLFNGLGYLGLVLFSFMLLFSINKIQFF